MGHIKFIHMLIKSGDFKDFQESYLKAKQNNEETFKHAKHEFKTHYGKAVCELIEKDSGLKFS